MDGVNLLPRYSNIIVTDTKQSNWIISLLKSNIRSSSEYGYWRHYFTDDNKKAIGDGLGLPCSAETDVEIVAINDKTLVDVHHEEVGDLLKNIKCQDTLTLIHRQQCAIPGRWMLRERRYELDTLVDHEDPWVPRYWMKVTSDCSYFSDNIQLIKYMYHCTSDVIIKCLAGFYYVIVKGSDVTWTSVLTPNTQYEFEVLYYTAWDIAYKTYMVCVIRTLATPHGYLVLTPDGRISLQVLESEVQWISSDHPETPQDRCVFIRNYGQNVTLETLLKKGHLVFCDENSLHMTTKDSKNVEEADGFMFDFLPNPNRPDNYKGEEEAKRQLQKSGYLWGNQQPFSTSKPRKVGTKRTIKKMLRKLEYKMNIKKNI